MLPEIWFYHLERSGLEAVLSGLLEKSLERGWRALVRTTSKERVAALDDALWVYRDDSFLAHGRADDPDPELQPVLLTYGAEGPENRQLLIVIDRAEPGEISSFERVILLFDGQDEDALKEARERWKTYKDAGFALAYWQQSPRGRWEKKA
jgi:DNA polymerase-3 subunit chi